MATRSVILDRSARTLSEITKDTVSGRAASPLRYPGGKWRIAPFFREIISLNSLSGYEYVEPYAGGASLALSLLFSRTVSRIYLNDLDPAIYCFWWSVLKRPDQMIRLIGRIPLTIKEWHKQRKIYSDGLAAGRLALGFATLYLNRTNHSGILNGGVIGGKAQRGEWKMDARFNRSELQRRIRRIADHGDKILVYRKDALAFLASHPFGSRSFIYLDPPYFNPGKALYLNAYDPDDHQDVQTAVRRLTSPWIISYDDAVPIRSLYRGFPARRIMILHTARSTHLGREVMYFSRKLRIPRIQNKARQVN